MQIVEKRDTMFGKKSYELAVPEVKTEKEFYGLVYDIAGIENVNRIECQGYSDMDTHENFITFKNRDEFNDMFNGVSLGYATDPLDDFSYVDPETYPEPDEDGSDVEMTIDVVEGTDEAGTSDGSEDKA